MPWIPLSIQNGNRYLHSSNRVSPPRFPLTKRGTEDNYLSLLMPAFGQMTATLKALRADFVGL